MRNWWPRSPSKYSTASTMCSSTRGPAMAPSLVTWPTSTSAKPRDLASRISSKLQARTWATVPGALSMRVEPHGLDRVDHHQRRVAGRLQAGGDVAQVDRGGEFERRVGDARAGGRAGASARSIPRRRCRARACPARASAAAACSSSVDLPIPGSPPTSTAEAGHEPAAQHAVQFGDAGGDARRRLGAARQADEADASGRMPPWPPAPGRASIGLLDDGVPLAAGLAAAGPLWR